MFHLKSGFYMAVSLLLSTSRCAAIHTTQFIRWVDCSENIPSTLDLTGVNLSNLPSTLHCGQIDVPMDYSRPHVPNNSITLGLAMYRPAKPKGVLFVFVKSKAINI